MFLSFIIMLFTGHDFAHTPQLIHFFSVVWKGLSLIMYLVNNIPIKRLLIRGHLPIVSFSTFFSRLMISLIKLESSTGIKGSLIFHDKFFENCRGVETFAKIVFNDRITDDEISNCCVLANKYGIELILQPEMKLESMTVSSDFCAQILDKFLERYQKVRLIPQVHKFLNVR